MKLTSTSFLDQNRIPEHNAFCKIDSATHVSLAGNANPQLAWSDVPAGTQSFAIICHDPDVPSKPDDNPEHIHLLTKPALTALFKGGSVWRDQALFDDSWGEVILMCGLPGTGKDAWIRAKCPGLPVVSLDDVRLELDVTPTQSQGQVVHAARERARALLRQRQPFVWNATSLTARRGQQVALFEQYHARVRIVFLETEWRENLRRNADRPDAVPEGTLFGMLERLEPPERWEAQSVEWHCV